jgi:hypothetical protein
MVEHSVEAARVAGSIPASVKAPIAERKCVALRKRRTQVRVLVGVVNKLLGFESQSNTLYYVL